jgi:hypothetical protein
MMFGLDGLGVTDGTAELFESEHPHAPNNKIVAPVGTMKQRLNMGI